MEKPKILIADDEKPTRDAMARILSPSCECLTAPDAELAMKLVEENPDLALLLTDYKMPGENGVSLIKRAKAANPSLACILITAFGEIELAVEAMKEGADDFITKPITDLAQMEQRVKKALEKHALSREVNCAVLHENLIESELFGHEKGSFTGADRTKVGKFEAASGGTLFLDEITEIDLATQVKLLRALESRTIQRVGGNEDIRVDFRLVAATNRDLAAYVREGKFRDDLYYRLNVIDIHLPALKERPGDIALLVSRFIKEFSAANGNNVTGIDAKAIKVLEDYPWPGNVRQLRNVVEKMCVLSAGGKLTLDDVPVEITSNLPATTSGSAAAPVAAQATLAETEKDTILRVLAECGNNKSQAAIKLGISRRTLHRKLNEWRSA